MKVGERTVCGEIFVNNKAHEKAKTAAMLFNHSLRMGNNKA